MIEKKKSLMTNEIVSVSLEQWECIFAEILHGSHRGTVG